MSKPNEENKKEVDIELPSLMPEFDIRSQYQNAERSFNARVNRAATKTTMLQNARASASQLNNMYDNAFDSVVQRMMNMQTPEWAKLASAKINKLTDIPKNYLESKVENTAQKFMSTQTGQKIAQKIEESMIKTYGKNAAKSMAKKIPLVCLAVGMECARDRWNNGDYIGAGFEGLSALTANIPGIGTAVSAVIDVGLATADFISSLGGNEEQKAVALTITKEDVEWAKAHDPFAKMKEQNPEQYEYLRNQANMQAGGWAKVIKQENTDQNGDMNAYLLRKMREKSH